MHGFRLVSVLAAMGALAIIAVAVAAVGLTRGSGGRSDAPSGSVSATPIPPGQPVPAGDRYGGLRLARADLAARLFGTAPEDLLKVRFKEARDAGWDGCSGVIRPDQACTTIFTGGLIAFFDAGGKTYRYHIVGSQIIATDFLKGSYTLSDGSPVEPALRMDLNALLADYARADLALRQHAQRDDVAVAAIIPTTFFNECLGFAPTVNGQPDPRCAADSGQRYPGAFVVLEHDGATSYYSVAAAGVVFHDQTKGTGTQQPSMNVGEVQQRMREDLAGRLQTDTSHISVLSYREVTWPDGCLGVAEPAKVCTQALVDGFLARLGGPDGKVYQYHGAGNTFIAASFFPNARITEPFP
jgi:hypothetical protein